MSNTRYEPGRFVQVQEGCLYLQEQSADPPVPPEGVTVIWQSDGTGTGADGDIIMKRQVGAVVYENYLAGPHMEVETVAAANTILAAESPKIFYLNLAGGFTSTLPAPAAGLYFKFIVKTAPTTAYVITTNAGADIMIGGINELEVDTNDDGPYDNNADTLNFVASVAVVGDWVEFVSDGTSWYFTGQTNADGGVTTSTT